MHLSREQAAWRILLGAFLIFLLLCSIVVYVAQWYVFQSSINLVMDLRVARGTASVLVPNAARPDARTGRSQLDDLGTSIAMDSFGQSEVSFIDPHSNYPVASITVRNDSNMQVAIASAPRFGLNKSPYFIEITNLSGSAEILLMDTGERDIVVQVSSSQMRATMTDQGRYLIQAGSEQTTVTARAGQAQIEDQRGHQITLDAQQQATIEGGQDREIDVSSADIMLLDNPFFTQEFNDGWSLYTLPEADEPPGQIYNAVFDGRPVVVIDRSASLFPGKALRHGEDGLVQKPGIDVSGFQSLKLRATFFVEEQDVSRCGIDGSECPMTFHIKFIDEAGQLQEFHHGFYAFDDPSQPPYRLSCTSCRSDHDRITLGSWYTYETNDLTQIFPTSLVTITEISFYASGHAYKVYVSEVNILGVR